MKKEENISGLASFLDRMQQHPYWNFTFLSIAWALTVTTSTLVTTICPLSAHELKATYSFSFGIFLLGAGASSVPSSWLFQKYGKLFGYSVGCWLGFIGSIVGSLAVHFQNLGVLYTANFIIGLGQGIGQFYRYSAVELAPAELKHRAVTFLLTGGIIASFLGPISASHSVHLIGEAFQGSYMLFALIALLNQIAVLLVKFPPHVESIDHTTVKILTTDALSHQQELDNNALGNNHSKRTEAPRPLSQILCSPLFIVSCTVATLAHSIMLMLMSNFTLDMVENGYSYTMTSFVMELHFLGMYAPGFVSNRLIQLFGTTTMALVGGVFVFTGSVVILTVNKAPTHWSYEIGMILVGVAWNFSFTAGNSMLATSYKPSEAVQVQSVYLFLLFLFSGTIDLLSVVVFVHYGWFILIYTVAAMMALYIVLFAVVWCLSPDKAATANNQQHPTTRYSEVEQDLLTDHDLTSLDYSHPDHPLGHTTRDSLRESLFSPRRTLSEAFEEYRSSLSLLFETFNDVRTEDDDMTTLRTMSVA